MNGKKTMDIFCGLVDCSAVPDGQVVHSGFKQLSLHNDDYSCIFIVLKLLMFFNSDSITAAQINMSVMMIGNKNEALSRCPL